MSFKIPLIFSTVLLLSIPSMAQNNSSQLSLHKNQQQFWNALKEICGNSYEGEVVSAPESDTVFRNRKLIMHVRSCENDRIRIPFIVENDLSRTWIISLIENGLELRHDHRHEDGSPDRVSFYGGVTPNSGRATVQYFPADQQTTDLLPYAAGNVWWIEIVPEKHFIYNLRRMGSSAVYSIKFDLSKTIARPEAPWGWED